MRGTTIAATASLSRSRHSKHWPAKSPTHLLCHLRSSRGQRKSRQSARYDVGVCVVPCFAKYRIKVNL